MFVESFIAEFILASLIMGLGIGLDAALATAIVSNNVTTKKIANINIVTNNAISGHKATSSRTHSHKSQHPIKDYNTKKHNKAILYWLLGITFTHTSFPMVGYLLSYYGVQQFPILSGVIGFIAFALIAQFIVSELPINSSDEDQDHSKAAITGALLLAVSWDALWSGPAKSAQVMDWPVWAIWLSFIAVGAVVATLSTLAYRLVIQHGSNTNAASIWSSAVCRWLQFSVIGYFGLLALVRYSFNWPWSNYWIFILSALLIAGYLMVEQYQLRKADHYSVS